MDYVKFSIWFLHEIGPNMYKISKPGILVKLSGSILWQFFGAHFFRLSLSPFQRVPWVDCIVERLHEV